MKKLKTKYGSALVFSLIVLFMGVVVALGVASTTIISQKMSGTTGKSVSSFQVADSGAEIFLRTIRDANKNDTLSDVLGSDCSGDTFTGHVGAGTEKEYKITFSKNDGTGLDCNDPLYEVDKIKSIGSYGETNRAIEVAVAAEADDKGCTTCTINMTGGNTRSVACDLRIDGENICDDEDGCADFRIIRFNGGEADSTTTMGSETYYQQADGHWARASIEGKNGDSTGKAVFNSPSHFDIFDDCGTGTSWTGCNEGSDKEDFWALRDDTPNDGIGWKLVICD